jgi:hypothetical protein
MPELQLAIRVVELIIAVMAVMALGDYLGNRVGRMRLATILGGIVLVTIILFAIYAAIVLT